MTRSRNQAVTLVGRIVLVLSGLGFPLTQAVIARFGRRGAVVTEGVAIGLLVRDAALVRTGLPARLQPLPRLLLWLELGAAAFAALAGPAAIARPTQRVEHCGAGTLEAVRRFAVGLLFGLHTYRFRIYLEPGRGRRASPTGSEPNLPSRPALSSVRQASRSSPCDRC